jgi:hypothetical protein
MLLFLYKKCWNVPHTPTFIIESRKIEVQPEARGTFPAKRELSAKKFLTEFLNHRFNSIDIRAHEKGKV